MKTPPLEHAAPASLEDLHFIAGEKMMSEAMEIVRKRLKLTPAKLALLVLRRLNPDEIISNDEEAHVRGLGHRDTLRKYKQDGMLPNFINGLVGGRKGGRA